MEKYKSIFDNLTDKEFEYILKECDFKFKKVEPGKGGLFIGGKRMRNLTDEEEKACVEALKSISEPTGGRLYE